MIKKRISDLEILSCFARLKGVLNKVRKNFVKELIPL